MSEERRRFSRIKISRPVTLQFADGHSSSAMFEDLSVGGCMVPSGHIPQIGTACNIKIFFDEQEKSRSIEIEGMVLRCEKGIIAVKFTTITPESLFDLKNLIRYNTSDPERIDTEIQNRPGIV